MAHRIQQDYKNAIEDPNLGQIKIDKMKELLLKKKNKKSQQMKDAIQHNILQIKQFQNENEFEKQRQCAEIKVAQLKQAKDKKQKIDTLDREKHIQNQSRWDLFRARREAFFIRYLEMKQRNIRANKIVILMKFVENFNKLVKKYQEKKKER